MLLVGIWDVILGSYVEQAKMIYFEVLLFIVSDLMSYRGKKGEVILRLWPRAGPDDNTLLQIGRQSE